MKKIKVFAVALLLVFVVSLPAFASLTIKNRTNFRFDIVIKDTHRRQFESINAMERLSYQCSVSGGQLIILKKGEEVFKVFFDDGDKYVITIDGDKIIVKKDRTI